MSGRYSKIKWMSNQTFGDYNLEGTIKTDNLSKSQLERYLKKKELESQRREEELREPRVKRNGKIIKKKLPHKDKVLIFRYQ